MMKITQWLLKNKLIILLFTFMLVITGLIVSPFPWLQQLPHAPIAVDAIPNTGENQQIVFTQWAGRSPQDVENQVSYPLSVQLMGIPGVKDVRTSSMFGFSSIAVIFHDDIEFYWSRTRLLEKLSSLPIGTLPDGVQPMLGPDATGLGQVYQYTLEGRDPQGNPIGGWGLDELRSIQDWSVRYALLAAEGVSEVASIGGFVREYQIDLNPEAMRHYHVTLEQVIHAVQQSNLDIGARTTEINQVQYLVRGVGFIKNIHDLEQVVVRLADKHTPILLSDVASITFGPAERQGALDISGAEAVGGIVTVRSGYNLQAAIQNVKEHIQELSPSLPARAFIDWQQVEPQTLEHFAQQQGLPTFELSAAAYNSDEQQAWVRWLRNHPQENWPPWLNLSQVQLVPFYDRSQLIQETLATLGDALSQQLLITVAVVLLLLLHLRAAFAVAIMLPLAVLLTFIAMRFFQIEANIVALAGIAIAIGTIVDVGIIITDNILQLRQRYPQQSIHSTILQGTKEVGPAVITAISTTVISFLPVLTMTGAEGKLFAPLAYTKTLVFLAAALLAIVVLPVMLRLLLSDKLRGFEAWFQRQTLLYWGLYTSLSLFVLYFLAQQWLPLGVSAGLMRNFIFVLLAFALVLGSFSLIIRSYATLLAWCLRHKLLFLSLPAAIAAASLVIMPSLDREFMPALDEGAFLLMPTTMPHASIGAALAVLASQDKAIAAIPEVDYVVGKIGRAETPLDPAPISMIETIIHYKNEYKTDEYGRVLTFATNQQGEFLRDANKQLIPSKQGKPYRQWREHIQSPNHIWDEIIQAAEQPGVTSAPLLYPIETRQLMLRTGMSANIGVKVQAPNLASLEQAALAIEASLRTAKGINSASVVAERIAGNPYLEIHLDRSQIARYGLTIEQVQQTIATTIGGLPVTRSVEGRERYDIRLRYQREKRQDITSIAGILVTTLSGEPIPLTELAHIEYVRGPQMIRSENTFLTAYVTFGAAKQVTDIDAAELARNHLAQAIADGNLQLPPEVSYRLTGSFLQQQSAMSTLSMMLPLTLLLIFLLLYAQFKEVSTSLMIFSGIAVAWGGGFIMLYLYGQAWFADFTIPWLTQGVSIRDIFQLKTTHLSIAVWVGFLALFGIAIDDGIIMGTYLQQSFKGQTAHSIQSIRQLTIEAGQRRVKPCLMTTATTLLALLPILTASGRGSDLMTPMAIPTLGGLTFVTLSMFVVPVLYCWREELKLKWRTK